LPICCSGQSPISFASRPRTDEGRLPLLNVAVVDPEYFETLKIPLVSGRHIETGDRAGQPLVALVSERVAKKFFAGASPIGERLRLGSEVNDTRSWRTIVGVVRDTRTDGLAEEPRGTLYLLRAQEEMRGGWVIVRSAPPAEQMTAQLRRALAEVDRNVPLERVQAMDAALAVEMQGPKFSMLLLTIFAAVVLGAASAFLLAVACAAALAPALRAMRIDPTIAMRAD